MPRDRLHILLALALLGLVTPLRGAATEAPVILVLGDSLSAGYGLASDQSWVALLERRLREQDLPHRVVNASISGDTTRGGLARLRGALARHRPGLVIIELGANDGLRGMAPQRMRDNLQEMIGLSRAQGARVLLVGIRLPTNYGRRYRQRFDAVFPELAETTGVALVPFLLDGVAQHRELFQADGVHPTAAAQGRMLDTVWAQLEPLLSEAMP
jgi:acyl-CoA thioesterase-1